MGPYLIRAMAAEGDCAEARPTVFLNGGVFGFARMKVYPNPHVDRGSKSFRSFCAHFARL